MASNTQFQKQFNLASNKNLSYTVDSEKQLNETIHDSPDNNINLKSIYSDSILVKNRLFNSPKACSNFINDCHEMSKKKHKCGICSIHFIKKSLLLQHLMDFHKEENSCVNSPHYCLICKIGFCTYQTFNEHLSIKHEHLTLSENKITSCSMSCGLCLYQFSQTTSLYQHLQSHALRKNFEPYLCSFCHTGFLDSYSLSLHTKTKHNILNQTNSQSFSNDSKNYNEKKNYNNTDDFKFAISTCKKVETIEEKRAKYREHYRRFQSKTYSCEFCNITFTRFCDLSNHDRNAHDEMDKEFTCSTCGKMFLTESRLKIHQNAFHTEKRFICDICNVRCKSKHTLRTHMRKHSGMFTCSYCNLSTASNAALISHLRIHTGEKPFICDLCGNSYSSKLGLTSHKRTHLQEALFKCNICGYTGSSHSSIYIHKQTHNSDKPFICDVCGKTFKIKVRLVDHQKIHFGIKNFVCEICSKAFLARYQLVQHSRTHSGEKPFQCHFCSKAFARKDGLSEHIRTHTGEKRYTCSKCMQTFSFYKTMKNHKCSKTQCSNKKSLQVEFTHISELNNIEKTDLSPSHDLEFLLKNNKNK
ncbi:oocyte zinc finger protein XlCOF6-like isoform X2 [Daktulosphaira vitifoliae]|nr:oocyte zinc finger protein XlCOF6-like isoform X2 [Daktulosphaira vitifoliae]